MIRVASIVLFACSAAGCVSPIEVSVVGKVDVGDACAEGADRFGVTLTSGGNVTSTDVQCGGDGSFSLALEGDDTASLSVDAMGCGLIGLDDVELGQASVSIDSSSGFADVGTIRVPIGECP